MDEKSWPHGYTDEELKWVVDDRLAPPKGDPHRGMGKERYEEAQRAVRKAVRSLACKAARRDEAQMLLASLGAHVSVHDAARILDMGEPLVEDLCERGELAATPHMGSWRIATASIRRYAGL